MLRFLRMVLGAVAAVLFGLLAPLVLLEIGLRIFAPQPHAINISEWHPVYGWRNRPGAHGFFQTREYRMEVRIDSLGLRFREVTRSKPAGTYRILGLGDSFAFGHGVAADSGFYAVAERALDARSRAAGGPRVEIVNTGVGKWGTAQEYLYLTREGFGFEPDAVALAFCIDNDFANNEEESVVRRVGDRLEPVPSPRPPVRLLQRVAETLPGYSFFAEHSDAINFIRIRASAMEAKHYERVAPGADATASGSGPAADSTITTRIMDAIRDVTRMKHVPLLVLFVPGLAQCPPPGWVRPPHMPSLAREAGRVDRLIAHLDSLGVATVYPLPELREATRTEKQHFLLDQHLTESGNRVVGNSLAAALIRAGCVPPAIALH
ncbi:MAG: hypothetical protein E6K72_03140 [Candidatus Eisenbacteria bacterium]|uniref:SGNH hydrolase-type esterase domain-containing protein n=1 Tax=Eiseniibacteriota bacterium TaxID=2212470 RepID=A0A538T2V0_UNCEI|nr:MAG: hypothetical protein E6K72_03140 [Candidatus Eisenbacteria bacterium]